MAYDEELADRIRALVGRRSGVTEKRMFGGVAFLVGGNLAVAASGQGGLLVRVDPASSGELIATTPAEPMVMRGRPTPGWVRVASEHVRDPGALVTWVERGASYAESLPAKGG